MTTKLVNAALPSDSPLKRYTNNLPDGLRLKSFSFDIRSLEMNINIFISSLQLFGNTLSARDINIELFADSTYFAVKATGILTLAKKDYTLKIEHNPSTNNYVLTVHTEQLPIFSIVSAVGAVFLPNDLQFILEKIFNINILNATISYSFNAMPHYNFVISGTPQLFGLKTLHVTALSIDYGGEMKLIQKYSP